MKKPLELKKKSQVVNFHNIVVTDLDGKELRFDVSKSLSNHIYQTTGDLGMLDFAMTMHKTGQAEISDEQKDKLVAVIKAPECPFLAVVKKEILNLLES
ncbi:MAG: hypothetical protein ACK5JD_07435 [Mangrovibacterium sp.]